MVIVVFNLDVAFAVTFFAASVIVPARCVTPIRRRVDPGAFANRAAFRPGRFVCCHVSFFGAFKVHLGVCKHTPYI